MEHFVQTNITGNYVNLTPIYPLPRPVIYRLYLDDGRCGHTHNEPFVS